MKSCDPMSVRVVNSRMTRIVITCSLYWRFTRWHRVFYSCFLHDLLKVQTDVFRPFYCQMNPFTMFYRLLNSLTSSEDRILPFLRPRECSVIPTDTPDSGHHNDSILGLHVTPVYSQRERKCLRRFLVRVSPINVVEYLIWTVILSGMFFIHGKLKKGNSFFKIHSISPFFNKFILIFLVYNETNMYILLT